MTVQWQAVDPDNDASELKINLECRLAGSEDWQTLASGLDNTGEFLWDTSKLERGGRYAQGYCSWTQTVLAEKL